MNDNQERSAELHAMQALDAAKKEVAAAPKGRKAAMDAFAKMLDLATTDQILEIRAHAFMKRTTKRGRNIKINGHGPFTANEVIQACARAGIV